MVEELRFSLKGGKELKDNFNLTVSQLFEEASREVGALGTYTDPYWEFNIPKYSIMDVDADNQAIIVYDNENSYIAGFQYSLEGDKLILDNQSVKRYKTSYQPMDIDGSDMQMSYNFIKEFAQVVKEQTVTVTEDKIKSEYEEKVDNIEQQYKLIEKEYNEVKTLYNQKLDEENLNAVNELFASFESELTKEEMQTFYDEKDKYSLSELEDKLFALIGKKKAQFKFNKNFCY